MVSLTPGCFTTEERAPGTHWVGGGVGPRAGMEAVARKKNNICQESNPGRPAHGVVTILTGLPRLAHQSGWMTDFGICV
jgi:hypothetical protein